MQYRMVVHVHTCTYNHMMYTLLTTCSENAILFQERSQYTHTYACCLHMLTVTSVHTQDPPLCVPVSPIFTPGLCPNKCIYTGDPSLFLSLLPLVCVQLVLVLLQ